MSDKSPVFVVSENGVSIDGGEPITRDVVSQAIKTVKAMSQEEKDALVGAVRKKMAQQDLEGKELEVTEEEETVEYRTFSTEKLYARFTTDALDKLMDDATVMRKIRIKADATLLPGEWDEQSKKLVTAINGN